MVRTVIISLCAIGLFGCSQWKSIAIGYRTVRATAKMAEDFDAALSKYLEATKVKCSAQHKPQTPEMAACLKPALELSWKWTGEKLGKKTGKGILPLLQSAQKSAKQSIDAGFDYLQAKKKCDENGVNKCDAWMSLLKPSFCAAWELFDAAMEAGAVTSVTDTKTYKTIKSLHSMVCR
jgi:hypothetical protein